MAIRVIWLAVVLLLTAAQGAYLVSQGITHWHRIEARLEVKRLAENTLRFYEARRPPTGDEFWRAVGRSEPLRDPWQQPYALDIPQEGTFRWRSAGEDQRLGTADDLSAEVPYGERLLQDLTRPTVDDFRPRSLDAR